jgi:hypothetical protein
MKTELLRYKIGFGVLMLLVIGLVGLVFVQASATKQDTKTTNAANRISDTLDNYIADNNVLPKSLSQAGIHNVPSTIHYRVLSSSKYTFCITYKGTSSGFDAASAAEDIASGGSISGDDTSSGSNFELDIPTSYHKGINCQTVEPYITTIQTPITHRPLQPQTPQQQAEVSGQQGTACDVSGYGTYYAGTIDSTTVGSGSGGSEPSPVVTVQPLVTTSQSAGAISGIQTLSIPADFNMFTSNCTAMSHSNLKAGDYVSVFLDNTDSTMPNALIDFSEAQ